jgi:two-component system NarL family response regulator
MKTEVDKSISVLLVDDHPMVQGGLKACLSFYDDIDIVGAIDDGSKVLAAAKEFRPDVILMDVSMPNTNGIDATEIVKEQLPNVQVLVFSMHNNAEFVTSAMQAGASGYVLKDSEPEMVYRAIKTVATGRNFYSSSVAQELIENPIRIQNEKLTTREQVVLSYIVKGKSSKEIGKALSISYRTVEAHRRNIKAKLNIESLAELIRYAVNHGLLDKH